MYDEEIEWLHSGVLIALFFLLKQLMIWGTAQTVSDELSCIILQFIIAHR